MIKIGITGGIGSGKSVVSKLFEIMGIPVYIADIEAKKITASSPEIKKQLTALFGEDLYSDGMLNKQRFASMIFNDKKALEQANGIIHPEVRKDFNRWAERQKKPVVAIETAILLEAGFEKETDRVIVVTAPVDLRVFRVVKRDKMPEEKVEERMNNQLSDNERIMYADDVIVNDDKTPVIPQVLKIFKQIAGY
ncbi:MAG: dephospho-CoA kinase [Candidatus Azobacteroides sp.]|nr:dephospho-CoA kinase [Candidatus Azobacteroides sp.]